MAKKRKIKGSSKLGWRIRDEYIRRKSHKRRGGIFNAKDSISRWSDKKLNQMVKNVYGDS